MSLGKGWSVSGAHNGAPDGLKGHHVYRVAAALPMESASRLTSRSNRNQRRLARVRASSRARRLSRRCPARRCPARHFPLCPASRPFGGRLRPARPALDSHERLHDGFNGSLGGGRCRGGCGPDVDLLHARGTRSGRPDNRAPGLLHKASSSHGFLPKGAGAFDYAAPRSMRIMTRLTGTPSILAAFGVRAYECGNACFRSALFGKHWASQAFSTQQKENVRWQRKKPRHSTSYSTTR